MFYFDTSVIVAYYCPEPLSERSQTFLISHGRPAISNLTELEVFSAISRKIRERGMNHKDGIRVTAKFLSHLDNQFYERYPIESQHYRLARDWIGRFTLPLRSLDALHLAVASAEGATLVTADQALAESAGSLGVDAILLSDH